MIRKTIKKISIGHKDIEKLLNVKLSDFVKKKISQYKLVYSPLSKEEQEQVIIEIIDTLSNPYITYAGPHRLKQWEKGWGQNLTEFRKEKKLMQYVRITLANTI